MLVDVRTLNPNDYKQMDLEQLSKVVLSDEPKEDVNNIQFSGTFVKTEEKEIEVYINNRTFGQSLQWRTWDGLKRQIWVEDSTKQLAEDWTNIPMTSCRCCHKENVQEYKGQYFEQYFDHVVLFSYANGYCEECAKRKSETVHPKPQLLKDEWVRVRKYEVGGEMVTFRTDKFGNVWYWK